MMTLEAGRVVLKKRLSWDRPSVWLMLLTLLISSVALAINGADPDLWGHIQYGRDLFRHGFPLVNTYSYTAVGYRWVNHENLSEVALALGMDHLGPIGMMLVKTAFGWIVLGLAIRSGLKQGAGLFSIGLVVLLMAINLASFWTLRPQLLTCLSLTLMIALLTDTFGRWSRHQTREQENRPSQRLGGDVGPTREEHGLGVSSLSLMETLTVRDMRQLWWLLPIFIFWTNSHGGFVAGLCILFAYFACRMIELIREAGWQGLPLVTRLAVPPLAVLVATLVNPYGYGLYPWLLDSLGKPRPEIVEWQRPAWFELSLLPFYLLLLVMLLSFVFSRRWLDGTHGIILLLITWQTCLHLRHLLFLAIAFGFWGIPYVDSFCRRFRVSELLGSGFQRIWQRPVGRVLSLSVFASLLVLTAGQLVLRISELRVDRRLFPIAAVEYLAEQKVRGRMVVTFNWAQYVIAALGAETEQRGVLVSFDGLLSTRDCGYESGLHAGRPGAPFSQSAFTPVRSGTRFIFRSSRLGVDRPRTAAFRLDYGTSGSRLDTLISRPTGPGLGTPFHF
jgi:membrane protein implicated in regulation of membrane protease activity